MPVRKWNPASLKFYLSPQRRLPCPYVPPRTRWTTEDCSHLAWGPCPCLCAHPWLSQGPTVPLTLPTIPTYHWPVGRPLTPSTLDRSKPSRPFFPAFLPTLPHSHTINISDLTSISFVDPHSWASQCWSFSTAADINLGPSFLRQVSSNFNFFLPPLLC